MFGFSLALGAIIVAYSLTELAPLLGPPWTLLALAQDTSHKIFVPLVPLSLGVAILRSCLYDIDVIIRRTLLYAVVTVLLGMAYLGCVLVLGAVLQKFTGQSQNQAVIVVATLCIAALFTPLRRRVQDVIDRRFYRSRYNAVRILAEFAASTRDENNLDQVSEHLIGIVDQTMQPASVDLWLRTRR